MEAIWLAHDSGTSEIIASGKTCQEAHDKTKRVDGSYRLHYLREYRLVTGYEAFWQEFENKVMARAFSYCPYCGEKLPFLQ